ncbi:hypothetical protein MRX96_042832 [Rhipicephalus microplus]
MALAGSTASVPMPSTTGRVPEDQPHAEGPFQEVRLKAALRRTKKLALVARPVNPAVMGMVLYRPSDSGGFVRGMPHLSLAYALSSRSGVAEIRVNYRRNIVVVNETTREDLEELWAISKLQGIPVISKKPADRWTSTGFLHGVGRDPYVETPMPGPPVYSGSSVCHQGGPHSHPAEQRKVATIMTSSTNWLSKRVVAVAVWQEAREFELTASTVNVHSLPGHPVPAPHTLRRSSPTRMPDGPMPPLRLADSGADARPYLLSRLLPQLPSLLLLPVPPCPEWTS